MMSVYIRGRGRNTHHWTPSHTESMCGKVNDEQMVENIDPPVKIHGHCLNFSVRTQILHINCAIEFLWGVVPDRHGEGGAEPEGHWFSPGGLCSNPVLWSRVLGSDRQNEVVDTGDQNVFPQEDGWTLTQRQGENWVTGAARSRATEMVCVSG